MKGLELIRIRCNMSQAFLAQKLGVTRQSVNLWEKEENGIPEKRLAQLEELFGIPSSFFGRIDVSQIDELSRMVMFPHAEEGHEYFCATIHPKTVVKHFGMVLRAVKVLVPIEEQPIITTDEKVLLAKKRLNGLTDEIVRLSTERRGKELTGHSLITMINYMCDTLEPILDIYKKFESLHGEELTHHVAYLQVLKDITTASALAFGAMNENDIPDGDPNYGEDDYEFPEPHNYYWIHKALAVIADEIECRKKACRPRLEKPQTEPVKWECYSVKAGKCSVIEELYSDVQAKQLFGRKDYWEFPELLNLKNERFYNKPEELLNHKMYITRNHIKLFCKKYGDEILWETENHTIMGSLDDIIRELTTQV